MAGRRSDQMAWTRAIRSRGATDANRRLFRRRFQRIGVLLSAADFPRVVQLRLSLSYMSSHRILVSLMHRAVQFTPVSAV